MKIEKDFLYHSYKMEYHIGYEHIISYLDFRSNQDEYDKWVNRHKEFIRIRLLEILTF